MWIPVSAVCLLLLSDTAASGLFCYQCANVDNPEACKETTQCKESEACITYSNSQGRNTTYVLGCSSQTNCNAGNNMVVIGKRSIPTSCKSCCSHSSYCNNKLCGESGSLNSTTAQASTGQVTSITTSTTSTKSPVTSTQISASTPSFTTTAMKSSTSLFPGVHLKVVPPTQTVKLGSMADFECSFDSPVNQAMNMTWTFTNLSGNVRTIYESPNANPPEVFIDVKEVAHTDAGVYTCIATNGSHTWTDSGTLKIPDTSITTTTASLKGMNVSNWNLRVYPSNQTVPIGENAVMLCQFDPEVQEPMTMTWTFTDMAGNTTRIFSEGELDSSMTFYVKELAISDEGLYTCHANFDETLWTASSFLHVQV